MSPLKKIALLTLLTMPIFGMKRALPVPTLDDYVAQALDQKPAINEVAQFFLQLSQEEVDIRERSNFLFMGRIHKYFNELMEEADATDDDTNQIFFENVELFNEKLQELLVYALSE